MGDYREPKHIYTTAPNMRDDNPVDVQECYELMSKMQEELKGMGTSFNMVDDDKPGLYFDEATKKREKRIKLLEDIKECLIWVEQNG